MSIYRLQSIKLLSLEIITLAFRDLTLPETIKKGKKKGKPSEKILKLKEESRQFLQNEWGELCADLAGINDLKSFYEKNKNGIKLNHFEITRRSRKFYSKRNVKNGK